MHTRAPLNAVKNIVRYTICKERHSILYTVHYTLPIGHYYYTYCTLPCEWRMSVFYLSPDVDHILDHTLDHTLDIGQYIVTVECKLQGSAYRCWPRAHRCCLIFSDSGFHNNIGRTLIWRWYIIWNPCRCCCFMTHWQDEVRKLD